MLVLLFSVLGFSLLLFCTLMILAEFWHNLDAIERVILFATLVFIVVCMVCSFWVVFDAVG